MSLKYKISCIFLLITMSVMMISCEKQEKEDLKQIALAALSKQMDIESYQFQGSLNIKLGAIPMTRDAHPLTTALWALIKESQWEWSGIIDHNPLSLEAEYRMLPSGVTQPVIAPLLLKDNKLYFQLPIINVDDEYYMANLSNPTSQDNPLPELSTIIASALFETLDSNTMSKKTIPVEDPDPTIDQASHTVITLEVSEAHEETATEAFRTAISEYMNQFILSGQLSVDQAGSIIPWEQMNISVDSPLKIDMTIDTTGYIRQIDIDMRIVTSTEGSTASDHHVVLTQSFDHINEPISFTKDIPTNIRAFDDVLQFIKKQ